MLGLALGLASLALCAGSRQEGTPNRAPSYKTAMESPLEAVRVASQQPQPKEKSRRVTKVADIANITEVTALARELHREVLESKCTVPGDTNELNLKGVECDVRVFVFYLIALDFPGTISTEYNGVALGSTNFKKQRDIDRQLHALMVEEALKILEAFKIPWLQEKDALRIYKLVIQTLLATGVFTTGTDKRLYRVFTLSAKEVYFCQMVMSDKGVNLNREGIATDDLMPVGLEAEYQQVRLRIVKFFGLLGVLEPDPWAIANFLLQYDHKYEDPNEEQAQRKEAIEMLRCYVNDDIGMAGPGCHPVKVDSRTVTRAMMVFTRFRGTGQEMKPSSRVKELVRKLVDIYGGRAAVQTRSGLGSLFAW